MQVAATFKRIFPEEFDRAIPVMRHLEVDKMLMQMDYEMWMWQLVGARGGGRACFLRWKLGCVGGRRAANLVS